MSPPCASTHRYENLPPRALIPAKNAPYKERQAKPTVLAAGEDRPVTQLVEKQ